VKIDPNEKFIMKNWEATLSLVEKTFQVPNHPLLDLLETLGERYMMAPASPKKDFHSSFPGGLAYHNLHVITWLVKFATLLAPKKYDMKTLVTVGILHDIGKVGTLEADYYVPTTEFWQRERGIFYTTSRKIQYMKIPHRSLYLAQHFYGELNGMSLSEEEYLAIMLHDGMYEEANRSYSFKEPELAYILHQADYWASRLEKDNEIIGW